MNLETMRLLVSKGLSADDLLEVAEAMAAKADPTAAERQARYRARKAEDRNEVTRDVTRDEVTEPPLSRPPNEKISNPPTHTPPKTITRARKGKHFLPAEWEPEPFSAGTESRSVEDGWPPGERKRQIEHFRAHHTARENQFSDWQQAWSTWVLNNRNFGNGRQSNRSGPSGNGYGTSTREIAERILAGQS